MKRSSGVVQIVRSEVVVTCCHQGGDSTENPPICRSLTAGKLIKQKQCEDVDRDLVLPILVSAILICIRLYSVMCFLLVILCSVMFCFCMYFYTPCTNKGNDDVMKNYTHTSKLPKI